LYVSRSSSNDSAPPSPESKISSKRVCKNSCRLRKGENPLEGKKKEKKDYDYAPFSLMRPFPTKCSTKEADGPAPLIFPLPCFHTVPQADTTLGS
jgi:hypothetical protein